MIENSSVRWCHERRRRCKARQQCTANEMQRAAGAAAMWGRVRRQCREWLRRELPWLASCSDLRQAKGHPKRAWLRNFWTVQKLHNHASVYMFPFPRNHGHNHGWASAYSIHFNHWNRRCGTSTAQCFGQTRTRTATFTVYPTIFPRRGFQQPFGWIHRRCMALLRGQWSLASQLS